MSRGNKNTYYEKIIYLNVDASPRTGKQGEQHRTSQGQPGEDPVGC